MKRTLALAALILAGAAAAPLPSLAASNVSLYIGTAPPAPVYERVPALRPGYVWAPGYWNWNGHRHVWAPGYWVVERPGYAYNAPVWYQNNGGWYMAPARWTAYGGDRGYGRVYERGWDRDRDGIPDRYEHRGGWDRDRDGIPDRYEHQRGWDRDGDGVPNRYDRRPDNPWRR
ncbi:hypothetical protein ACI48D_12790 [Massilia sp. LXY-6]|uniref:YXWGXW repeat-containing protein n=1 Tax=Massilia sp. LXY-6 TaxID=3379823 RepID=UPI003EE0A41D